MTEKAKCRCGREFYVLSGTTMLVCRTCDFTTVDRGPIRPLREQVLPS